MALRGHVFDKQLFSSECFALFIDTFLGKQSGIVNGCAVSNTTNSVSIGNGYFCLQGRFLQEEGGTTLDLETVEQDTYCKLICEIDLSKENTTSSLNQATYKILTDKTDYPTLTQGDITQPDTVYQYEFAKFKNTSTGIQDFVDTRVFLDFDSIYAEIRRNIQLVLNEIETEKDEFFVNLNQDTETEFNAFKATLLRLEGEFQTFLNQLKEDSEADIEEIKKYYTEDFEEWFATIKDALDGDTAGKLLNMINEVESFIPTKTSELENDSGFITEHQDISGKANVKKTYNIALDAEWTGTEAPYTKTVQVEGILATDIVSIYPIYSETLETRLVEKEEYNKISMITSADGSVTLTCDEEVPTMELNVRLEVVY